MSVKGQRRHPHHLQQMSLGNRPIECTMGGQNQSLQKRHLGNRRPRLGFSGGVGADKMLLA